MAMQIPGYRVIRKINQGGMSTVYLAIQISVGRVVALKVMTPQLNNDPAFSERFQREATIVGQLSHPNIVAIYDIGRHDELNYIAMDYLPNGSVHDRMVTGLSGEEALQITREIACALDHAHEKGYVHRDIKPENILFRADNSAVLSDFGVARGLSTSSRMTHAGTVVGTPHYMSPEQAKGQRIDGRSDLYSLGIVLYEILTGAVPYQGDEAVTIALKHISAPIPRLPLQYLAYQKILDKLLAKDPEQRFQRGRELATAIEELEKNHRGARVTAAHPADLTVINLFNALIDATRNALRWRWHKLRNLRWSPQRGFYTRFATNATDIFFNEQQQSPAHFTRVEQETKVHETFNLKGNPLTRAGLITAGILALWCGFSIWLAHAAPDASSNAGWIQGIAFKTADFFIELPKTHASNSDLAAAPEIVVTSSVAAAINTQTSSSNATTAILLSPVDAFAAQSSSSDHPPVVTYALTVKTTPANAKIRILNIPDRYQPGIELAVGRYQLEVSASGYDTHKEWIDIVDADARPEFVLQKTIVPGTELSSQITTRVKEKGPEMISIPLGSFFMGNKNDPLSMPVHKVSITRAFAISKYEITFADYDMFAQATQRPLPADNRWGRDNRPVINVSFDDAKAYAAWLSETTGKKYRLPTESEWEYVARADTTTAFWWGDDIKDAVGRANCRRGCNSKFSGLFGSKTAPVGSYPANGFGIYDTAGNVAEWVQDCFVDNYTLHPKNGQAYDAKNCDTHVVRGGSAKNNVQQLTNDKRDYHRSEIYNDHLGFRVVMELK